ncbi:MAG: CNP1-like family protein [Gammaproteobacteria bacterium]
MVNKFSRIVLVFVATAVSSALLAAPAEFEYEFDEPAAWKEAVKALPNYPRDEDLLPVDIQMTNADFEFFIDGKTIMLGEDNVITYTTVIKSDSGAKNVLREGMRCGFDEYKVYAYGASDASFYINKTPEWQSVPRNGTNAYRKELANYMCGTNLLPLKPKQILDRIRYPQHIPNLSD